MSSCPGQGDNDTHLLRDESNRVASGHFILDLVQVDHPPFERFSEVSIVRDDQGYLSSILASFDLVED